ncbi:MAG: STAS domain-containing protein [Planctomycetes bacterium]|nr:STAS domain-containing protein [Planctomycetota bacterium]
MLTPQGTLHVYQNDQTITFRVDGCGRATNSLPLRRFAEEALAAGAANLRVDLRRCTHMDSTFIGTLLQLKRLAEKEKRGSLVLLSPSTQCGQILRQMGLERILVVESAVEEVGPWTELGGEEDETAFKCNAVEAHQELATLEGPVGETFRRVVRCLMQDPEAKKLGK